MTGTRHTYRGLMSAIVGFAWLLTATGCPPERPARVPAERVERVYPSEPVAEVNGREIPYNEFRRRIDSLPNEVRSRYGSLDRQGDYLQSMVAFEALADEADAAGYGEDPRVVAALHAELERQAVRARLEAADAKVSEEDVERAWESGDAADIEVPGKRRAYAAVLRSREAAEAFIADLTAAGAPTVEAFRAATAERSIHYSAAYSGDLGWLSKPGALDVEYRDPWRESAARVVFANGLGLVAAPVETQPVWTVVFVAEILEDTKVSLEDARPSIRAELEKRLFESARAELVEELSPKIAVEVDKTAVHSLHDDAAKP